jgi:hypothetical protein
VEVRGEAEMACQPGSDHAPDQVARHVAGDVGGKRAGGFSPGDGGMKCRSAIGSIATGYGPSTPVVAG